ncbi:ATP-grasp domain-containing protein [Allosphingosinicella humi]
MDRQALSKAAARTGLSPTVTGPVPHGDRRLGILLTSAGRRVELLRCFRRAGAELGAEIEIIACDCEPRLSAACREADAAFAVPTATDADYAEAVLEICARRGVGLVVPTIDPELPPLSLAAARFAAAGVRIAISEPAVVEIARDKLVTAGFLAAHRIPAPRTLAAEAATDAGGDWTWPALAKPRHGSSGRGIRIVHDESELAAHATGEPFVVQELLEGREFTVNLFFDRDGHFRCAVPHERLRIRAGEVEKGVTRHHRVLERVARQIADVLPGARGALCFQAMVGPGGEVKVFEINARFGGGYPLADAAGAPFARWLIEEQLGLPSTAGDAWREDVLMLRYDAAIFTRP